MLIFPSLNLECIYEKIEYSDYADVHDYVLISGFCC